MQSLQTTSIIHTHTHAQIYTFSHASPPFSFSRPHPLFLLFNTRTHAQINTHTHSQPQWFQPMAPTLSLPDLQRTRYPWPSLNTNMWHATPAPFLQKPKLAFSFFLPAASLMTRSVSFCDKALHDQSSARLFWKGLRHCFYLELSPAIIYITQHGTITHSASVF